MRLVRNFRMNGGSSTPSICTSSWLRARPPPMPPIPPGIMKSLTRMRRPSIAAGYMGSGASLREAKSCSRQAAVSRITSPPAVIEPHGPYSGAAQRLAAHADGIDLVDEDHAGAAPLAGELARLADQEHDDDDVHPYERLREAGARHRHDRRVE